MQVRERPVERRTGVLGDGNADSWKQTRSGPTSSRMEKLDARRGAESYSAATGSSSGSSGSVWLSVFSDGAMGAVELSRRKSTIKSCKHSTGIE